MGAEGEQRDTRLVADYESPVSGRGECDVRQILGRRVRNHGAICERQHLAPDILRRPQDHVESAGYDLDSCRHSDVFQSAPQNLCSRVGSAGNACVRSARRDESVRELERCAAFGLNCLYPAQSDETRDPIAVNHEERGCHSGSRNLPRGRHDPRVSAFGKYDPPFERRRPLADLLDECHPRFAEPLLDFGGGEEGLLWENFFASALATAGCTRPSRLP